MKLTRREKQAFALGFAMSRTWPAEQWEDALKRMHDAGWNDRAPKSSRAQHLTRDVYAELMGLGLVHRKTACGMVINQAAA